MKRVWITVGVLVAILVVLTGVAGVLLKRHVDGRVDFASPAVLEIDLEGEIVEKFPADPFIAGIEGASHELFDIVRAVDAAAKDDRIRGIYLRVGLPGYGWAKAEEIRDRLAAFRKTGKFVYAYLRPTDELGYYVALAADSIYLLPDGGIEMNGFRVETPFIRRTFEKLGLEAQVENIGVYKSAADMLKRDNMSDEEREVTESILRERYDRFVDAVVDARGVDPADFTVALNRGVYLAEDLQRLGLVDDQLYESEVRVHALSRTLGRKGVGRLLGRADAGKDEPREERKEAGPKSEVAVAQEGERTAPDSDELLEADAAEHLIAVDDYVGVLPPPAARSGPKIALVYAVGAIAPGEEDADPLYGRTMGSVTVIDMLREVAEEGRVDAVVVRVDSPGGDAWASEEIWAQLEELRRTVPVVVSMSDVAGSGGYYIAAGADEIVAAPSTITGSIGILGVIFNASKTWDKLGVSWGMVKTNEAADFPTTIRPLTEEERATFRAIIQDLYRGFVARVAEARERSVEQIDSVAQGRIWSGMQARQRGLVDRVGGLDVALEAARELAGIDTSAEVGLLVYPKEKSFFQRLIDMATLRSLALGRRSDAGLALRERAASTVARELGRTLTGASAALRGGPRRPLAVMPFVPQIR